MNPLYQEILLVLVNLVIWQGPAAVSIRRRTFSLLHPSSVFPLLVSISMLVALTERWFNWAGRGDYPGLRITTRFFNYDSEFFILPLAILAVAGLTYFLGIRLALGRVVSGDGDMIHLRNDMPFVPREFDSQLVPVALISAVICMMPFILFGQGYGFFWAGALVYAFNFIPALMYQQKARWGTIFLVLGLIAVGIRGSNGDFIYYFLPLLIFSQFKPLIRKGRLNIMGAVLLVVLVGVLITGTVRMYQERGYWYEEDSDENLVSKIMVREYGFEVFSILIHESSPWGNAFGISPYGSWFVQEVKEAVPSFMGMEKLRMGQEVAKAVMPFDYSYLPDAGFYRFFLFSFYYDLGWPGALAGSMSLGLVFGSAYRYALRKTEHLGVVWPLFVYLPIPVYSEMVVNGAISYGLIHVGIAAITIWLIARVTMLNVFGLSGYARELQSPER